MIPFPIPGRNVVSRGRKYGSRADSTVNFAESAKFLCLVSSFVNVNKCKFQRNSRVKKYLAELISSYLEDLYEFYFE